MEDGENRTPNSGPSSLTMDSSQTVLQNPVTTLSEGPKMQEKVSAHVDESLRRQRPAILEEVCRQMFENEETRAKLIPILDRYRKAKALSLIHNENA